MGHILVKGFVLPRLAELFGELENIEIAVLFGSLARNGFTAHDVDIAVKFSDRASLLDLGYVVSQVARALCISEEDVDIVDLDCSNPVLLFKVLSEGIMIKGSGEALKQLVERASLYPDAVIELREWGTLDPEPKPDKAILLSRIEEIRRNSSFLKERILRKKPDELDYGEILALERAVHRIIEAMLDVCRHLVAVYSLGLAESYGEYALKLAKAGKMPKELAETVSRLVGLRNILVHRYLEVDVDKLYSAAREIAEAEEFIEWVQSLISNS